MRMLKLVLASVFVVPLAAVGVAVVIAGSVLIVLLLWLAWD